MAGVRVVFVDVEFAFVGVKDVEAFGLEEVEAFVALVALVTVDVVNGGTLVVAKAVLL